MQEYTPICIVMDLWDYSDQPFLRFYFKGVFWMEHPIESIFAKFWNSDFMNIVSKLVSEPKETL